MQYSIDYRQGTVGPYLQEEGEISHPERAPYLYSVSYKSTMVDCALGELHKGGGLLAE